MEEKKNHHRPIRSMLTVSISFRLVFAIMTAMTQTSCSYTSTRMMGYSNKSNNNQRSRGRNYDLKTKSNAIEIPKSLTHQRNQTPLNCPHFDTCPGCITNKNYDSVPTIQSAKLFFSKYESKARRSKKNRQYDNDDDDYNNDDGGDFYQTVIPSNIQHYRTQAKLVVRSKSAWGRNGCIFGLYERNSHNLVEIPKCVVHHPSINEAIDVLSEATAKVGTVGYNEDSHDSSGRGGLRYVQLQVERKTNKVCMTLIWNGENLKDCQPGLSRLIKACKKLNPDLFHSIFCHTNASYGNSIFLRGDRHWHPMDGPEFVREIIPGKCYSSNSVKMNTKDYHQMQMQMQIADIADPLTRTIHASILRSNLEIYDLL